MIAQSLGSAWLLTFSVSLDDVVVSAFLSGPGSTTMPLVIFSRARLGLSPSVNAVATVIIVLVAIFVAAASLSIARDDQDRKSTRLNSSHLGISYAVFCLKKKKKKKKTVCRRRNIRDNT